MWSKFSRSSCLAALLTVVLLALVGPAIARTTEVGTARLGISAGEAIADLPPGVAGPALEQRLPLLFETAARVGVRIETASVGQGFYTADGELLSERDLDLVVAGSRDDVNALGAILGRAWDQGSVFIWHADAGGPMATATIPLPGGAELLTDAIYRDLVVELADGGHVRYAGPDSLLFVANTGDEPQEAFAARMGRVRDLLERAAIRTGPLQLGRAEQVTLERDNYDEHIRRLAPEKRPLPAPA